MKNNRLELLSLLLTDENLDVIPNTYVDIYYEIMGDDFVNHGSFIDDFQK